MSDQPPLGGDQAPPRQFRPRTYRPRGPPRGDGGPVGDLPPQQNDGGYQRGPRGPRPEGGFKPPRDFYGGNNNNSGPGPNPIRTGGAGGGFRPRGPPGGGNGAGGFGGGPRGPRGPRPDGGAGGGSFRPRPNRGPRNSGGPDQA